MVIDAQMNGAGTSRPSDDVFTAASYDPGRTLHLVLFRYQSKVTLEQKKEVMRRFLALKDSPRQDNGQPYILFVYGGFKDYVLPSGLEFEQGYILGFKSGGDRNYYEGAPIVTDPKFFDLKHQDFKNFVGPLLHKTNDVVDGVLVLDYKDASLDYKYVP